jgi:hypothetical protein
MTSYFQVLASDGVSTGSQVTESVHECIRNSSKEAHWISRVMKNSSAIKLLRSRTRYV